MDKLPSAVTCRLAFSRDWTKLSLLRFRHFDGYVASMHQAGNHWLRHILAMMLHEVYGTPAPDGLGDVRVVGGPKCPTQLTGIPRLVFSHKICSPLVHSLPSQVLLRFPRYVVLVRDLRAQLVSHYARFNGLYAGKSFSQYLRGDVWGRQHNCDVWDSIRFLNCWGSVQHRMPERVTVVRYEDLKQDTVGQTMRVWNAFHLPAVARDVVERAVTASTKDKMAHLRLRRENRGAVVRQSDDDPLKWYSAEDRHWLEKACQRFLRHDFGYDYGRWESGDSSSKATELDVSRTAASWRAA